MKRAIFLTIGLGLILLLSLSACDLVSSTRDKPGRDVSVRMGQATWDTGHFQAQVFKHLLEELGYIVRPPETLDNVAFYFFAAQGDVDFWPNGWFPLHNSYFDYEQVNGKVRPVGFQVEGGALQGYMIDKATAEEFGISNLADLENPEIAALFDEDGDGLADLTGCNDGWSCAQVTEHHLDAYDLRDTVQHVQGDYSALMRNTIQRYQGGGPILFYTWTPNWTVSDLIIDEDVVWLSVPFSALPYDPEADTAEESVAGCAETPCDLGFGLNDIRVVANNEFLAENPAAAALFESVKIPLADIAAQNAAMSAGENSEEDLIRHAGTWIEENRELVDGWLLAARNAASK
jgi:glycine betaine/proline transport system substrate-binding protein